MAGTSKRKDSGFSFEVSGARGGPERDNWAPGASNLYRERRQGSLFAKAETGCPGRGPAGYNGSTLPILGDLRFFFF
jgi:hypothetical protein